ncbi:MAG: AAA family ATPase, partial [Chitinophagaceae bacterium]|nr:AAA family ATPase [Anaerolineae bacterium]
VAEGEILAEELANAMIEDELVGHIVLENGDSWPLDKMQIARTWGHQQGQSDRHERVMPGEAIVGSLTGKDSLLIFRQDSTLAPSPDQAIKLHWRTPKIQRESVEISVSAPPRSSSAAKVLQAIYEPGTEGHGVVLHRFQSEMQDGSLQIHILVDAPLMDAIERLQASLRLLQQNGTITEFKIWQLFPGQKIMIAGKSDKRQQNPYTLRQVRDSSMFFGREEEIARVINCIEKGETFVVLYGQKRIGKTSLLVQLETLLPQSRDVLPVLFDAHSISPFEPLPFLLGLADAATRKLDTQLKRADQRRGLRLRRRDLQSDPYGAFAAWVNRAQKQLGDTRLLFMIDEFTRAEEEVKRGKLQENFFDGLQWLAGNQGIGFLLCVHDNVMKYGSHSWGLLQRGQPISLDLLDHDSAVRLVRQPLERLYQIDNEMVDYILNLTNCHPYFINGICLELVARMSRMPYERVSSEDLQSAISAVMRTGDHYFSHYRSRVDEFTWTVLRTLSDLSDTSFAWVTTDEIRSAMERYGAQLHRWQIADSIGELKRAGFIDARDTAGRVAYRVTIKLFHIWLRWQTTTPVLRDLQREKS